MPLPLAIKPGVRLVGIKPELVLGLAICQAVYHEHGWSCVITSATEGQHSRASLHYAGCAADLRLPTGPEADASALVARLKEALGAEFDVVLEATHVHVEWQPKG